MAAERRDRIYINATECDIAQANPFEFPLMCRSIRTLFNFEPPVTEAEVRAASLQFVGNVTGFNKPWKANETGSTRTPARAGGPSALRNARHGEARSR
jgi:Uncharacterized conserved protein (DUF2277)